MSPNPYYRGLRDGGGPSARLQIGQLECQVVEHEEEGTFKRKYRGKWHQDADDVRGNGLCPRSLVFVPPDADESSGSWDSDAEDDIAEELYGKNRVRDEIARELGTPVTVAVLSTQQADPKGTGEAASGAGSAPRNKDGLGPTQACPPQGDPTPDDETNTPEDAVAAAIQVAIDRRSLIVVHVEGRPVSALLDTGAHVSVVTRHLLRSLPGYDAARLQESRVQIESAAKTPMEVSHQYPLTLQIQGHVVPLDVQVVIEMVYPLVLGVDFCRQTRAKIDFSRALVTMETRPEIRSGDGWYVSPYTTCRVAALVTEDVPDGTLCLVEANQVPTEEGLLLIEPAIAYVMDGQMVIGVSNEGPYGCTLSEDTLLAQLHILGGEDVVVPIPAGGQEDRREEPVTVAAMNGGSEPWGDPGDAENLQDGGNTREPSTRGPSDRGSRVATAIVGPHGAVIDLRSSALTPEEAGQLKNILNQYTDVFVGPDGRLGCTDLLQHTIRTDPEQPPISQRPYKVGYHARQIIEDQVNELLAQGLIKPSESPWASPVVLVAKKDGTTRFCVDFRKLNQVTRMEQYPIPDIRQSLDVFGQAGATYFSTLDLKSAFWQVRMDPESAPKTAFITVDGVYEFTVLPFGLCGAPITFSRLMARAMRGLIWKNCLVYLDDVVVFSRTFPEHLEHLKQVLQRLRVAKLKLSPTKCVLARTQVHYLGHIVSGEGIAVDPKKIEAVESFPEPTSVKEVRQFLGLAGYYRRYCRGFSKIAQPLHSLTKKGVAFQWTEETQDAFDQLKGLLISAPVLAYPNFDLPYRLYTDASGIAVGHVLSQDHDEGEKVIAYGGRALTSTERRYGVTELEFLAVIHAITTNDCYLRFSPFTVVTDHAALKPMIEQKEPKGRISRWITTLSTYKMTIEYRPGKKHANADACSRREYPTETALSEEPPEHMFAAVTRRGGKVPVAPGELRYEHSWREGLRLTLWLGDITKFQGCAIVNAANEELRHGGGVARCISRMGGPTIQKESHEYVKKNGPLRVTEVVSTGAGNLNFAHLIHAVGPRCTEGEDPPVDLLYETILAVLAEAVRLGVEVLVMPMISTGIFAFPAGAAVEAHKQAFDVYAQEGDLGRLREIQVVDIKTSLLDLLEEAYRSDASSGPVETDEPTTSAADPEFTESAPQTDVMEQVGPTHVDQGPEGGDASMDLTPVGKDPRRFQRRRPVRRGMARVREEDLGLPDEAPIFRNLEGCDEDEVLQYFKHAQENDEETGPLLRYLRENELPLDEAEATRLERIAPDYYEKDDILYRVNVPSGKRGQAAIPSLQLVLPKEFVHDLLHHYHDVDVAAHRRYAAMMGQIRPKYFWRSMAKDLGDYLRTCDYCARADRRAQQMNAPMQPTEPAAIFMRIHQDIVGPLTKTKEGYRYILVMIDSFSRWTEAVPLVTQTALDVAESFYNHWVCRYGVPKQVVTDRGRNFTAALTQAVNRRLGIRHILTSAYHPQANGVCERRNKSLKEALQRMIDNKSEKWAYYLPAATYALNSAINASTGYSPYFLLFGREARRAVDFLLPVLDDHPADTRAALGQVTHKIAFHEKEARKLDLEARDKNRHLYDQRVREEDFQVGDMVWCYTPDTARKYQTGRKLVSPYAGPYVITQRVSPVTVRLRRLSDDKEADVNVHVNRLKRRYVRTTRPTAPPLHFMEGEMEDEGPLPPDMVPDEDWVTIQALVAALAHFGPDPYWEEDPYPTPDAVKAIRLLWPEGDTPETE